MERVWPSQVFLGITNKKVIKPQSLDLYTLGATHKLSENDGSFRMDDCKHLKP